MDETGAVARPLYLARLESEAIHLMREVAAEFSKPGKLCSVGKDSSVMLHLLQKAFHPGAAVSSSAQGLSIRPRIWAGATRYAGAWIRASSRKQ